MAKILITSGPTREFLDPVRFISNRSSGRMGVALATAALESNHEVTVVSGPVEVTYPSACKTIFVETTQQMSDRVHQLYPSFDGIVAAAAPCDFRPILATPNKIKKTGTGMVMRFEETDDILKSVSRAKNDQQWSVGFALETDDAFANAAQKLKDKNLDLIVLNGPEAMHSTENKVRIIGPTGVIAESNGSKTKVAKDIFSMIAMHILAEDN